MNFILLIPTSVFLTLLLGHNYTINMSVFFTLLGHTIAGPYHCWAIPLLGHTIAGSYHCWVIPLRSHTIAGSYHCWVIPLLGHTITGPYHCWVIPLWGHTIARSYLCWVIPLWGHTIAGQGRMQTFSLGGDAINICRGRGGGEKYLLFWYSLILYCTSIVHILRLCYYDIVIKLRLDSTDLFFANPPPALQPSKYFIWTTMVNLANIWNTK